jgi:hypothetical protein
VFDWQGRPLLSTLAAEAQRGTLYPNEGLILE